MGDVPPFDYFCRRCGYALRGIDSNRCPECGREFDPARPQTMSRRSGRWISSRPGTIMILAAGLFVTAYVIAYVELVVAVRPSPPANSFNGVLVVVSQTPVGPKPRAAIYRVDRPWINLIFRPANWADRRLRPAMWNEYGHFARAAETASRAMESKKPDLVKLGIRLRDDIDRAAMFREGTPNWVQLDAIVWKQEAELRKRLP